jgi:hypothetical protein
MVRIVATVQTRCDSMRQDVRTRTIELKVRLKSSDNVDMAQPAGERRKHLRRPVLLNCRVEGVTVAGPLQITDLSESGCFIATSHPLALDSQITLFVTLEGDEIKIIGRVVRVQPGRGVGIKINVSLLSQYARLALEDFLRESLSA